MMTPRRRELLLQACDGWPDNLPYLYLLNAFRRCDDILAWLIEHKFTGQKLYDWITKQHERSVLSAGAFVIQRLEREKESRPVYAGRDFLLN